MLGSWIPQGRQVVKKVLGNYHLCRKFNTVPFTYPKIMNLLKHRVNLVRPFLHTELDYTVHLWVHKQDQLILIFICLEVRAVHLELLEDMSVHSFITVFIQFLNMWDIPSHQYSDNAKSFIAICDLLQ